MRNFRRVLCFTAMTLAGCAAAPKQVMPVDEQVKGGFFMAGLTQCTANGMMDAHIASKGKVFIESRLNQFVYTPANVQAGYERQMKSGNEPSKTDCATMAMTVHGWIDQVKSHNEGVARDRQSLQDAINNRPRSTYCNQIGSQTLCSTY